MAKNDAVLMPANCQYRFNAKENAEPLVMLRIGCALDQDQDVLARVDAEGRPFDGYSEQTRKWRMSCARTSFNSPQCLPAYNSDIAAPLSVMRMPSTITRFSRSWLRSRK